VRLVSQQKPSSLWQTSPTYSYGHGGCDLCTAIWAGPQAGGGGTVHLRGGRVSQLVCMTTYGILGNQLVGLVVLWGHMCTVAVMAERGLM
jgi:hypothetical protein